MNRTLLLASAFLGFGLPVCGTPIVFVFMGSVDASGLGLLASSSLTIQYSYDPTLAPFAGSNAVYPMDFTVKIDGFTLQGHGVLSAVIQPTYQQIELNAATFVTYAPGYNGAISGDINGATYQSIDLSIIDNIAPLDMLASTNLPTSSIFITKANFIQFEASNGNPGSNAHILKQFGPTEFTFSATTVPEPGTLGSAFLSGIAFVAFRRRRWSHL